MLLDVFDILVDRYAQGVIGLSKIMLGSTEQGNALMLGGVFIPIAFWIMLYMIEYITTGICDGRINAIDSIELDEKIHGMHVDAFFLLYYIDVYLNVFVVLFMMYSVIYTYILLYKWVYFVVVIHGIIMRSCVEGKT